MQDVKHRDSLEMMVLEIPLPGEGSSTSSSFDHEDEEEARQIAARSTAGGYASINNLPARIAARRRLPAVTEGDRKASEQITPIDDRTGQIMLETVAQVQGTYLCMCVCVFVCSCAK